MNSRGGLSLVARDLEVCGLRLIRPRYNWSQCLLEVKGAAQVRFKARLESLGGIMGAGCLISDQYLLTLASLYSRPLSVGGSWNHRKCPRLRPVHIGLFGKPVLTYICSALSSSLIGSWNQGKIIYIHM